MIESKAMRLIAGYVLGAILLFSCDTYRSIRFVNSNDEECLVFLNENAIIDSNLSQMYGAFLPDSLLLENNTIRKYELLELGIGGWTDKEFEQVKASVSNIIQLDHGETVNYNEIGFSYDNVVHRSGFNNKDISVTCPLLISGSNNAHENYYFPMTAFRDTSLYVGRDTFVNRWYSSHLLAMNEPKLSNESQATNENIIRFLWLRTFHEPVSIRLNSNETGYRMVAKSLTGKGGCEPGTMAELNVIDLNNSQILTLEAILSECKFYEEDTTDKSMGKDGSQWIVELQMNGKYHVVDRWSPEPEECLYTLGKFLIQASSLKSIKPMY